MRPLFNIAAFVVATLLSGCMNPRPGAIVLRNGDEIVVAGQSVHTGTPVVLWMDPDGYDAYRVERRFAPFDQSAWETSHVAVAELKTPNRYGLRQHALTPEQIEKVRGGGWDLPLLQEVVDQFVIHFDASGTSRQCFKVLHDMRDLSVHFMLDLDGTIYQTLDAKERAWHATSSNTRSVGIEIANPGAFPLRDTNALERWYATDADGRTRIRLPKSLGDGGIRTTNFVGRPARNELVVGKIQGQQLKQYDFTPEQYRALIHLTAALCKVFPKIRCDYPRDASGRLLREKLPEDELNHYQGVLGHYHVQKNKVDPGPAFQWDYVIEGARELMGTPTAATAKGGARHLMLRE
ncbi:MAG TPA: peptidoglycan recognition family protein [Candidatus Limnocylindria bacterium]|nr:peptidoglycan recognition family protein [Candidatus Limnocylindria bacterium]